ncbi:MAG: class I tRNA ligase family protein, partial [Anaerolineales bacterium]|uniref:class I tRNA ligase family protein n=1 Tax=Candidatus Villigracilis proximus TaxID=3140683 RepID=UPI003135DC5A|nr:class I tRNA ligase family protein [Anaerolineales bacterium]
SEAGWETKKLYVWFEAVIGYLSAPIEWSQVSGQKDAWREWWINPQAKQFHFIGKDNIFFHTSLWPAELMGVGSTFMEFFAPEEEGGKLILPYDVPANQFMNLEGKKISGSRGWAVWGRDALTRFDPDAIRYYLTVNMPESKDSDWDWKEFVARNNNELVGDVGNLAIVYWRFVIRTGMGKCLHLKRAGTSRRPYAPRTWNCLPPLKMDSTL